MVNKLHSRDCDTLETNVDGGMASLLYASAVVGRTLTNRLLVSRDFTDESAGSTRKPRKAQLCIYLQKHILTTTVKSHIHSVILIKMVQEIIYKQCKDCNLPFSTDSLEPLVLHFLTLGEVLVQVEFEPSAAEAKDLGSLGQQA